MPAPKVCECGRPVRVVIQARNKKASKRARAKKPLRLKHHELCAKCYRAQNDRTRLPAKKPA